MYLLHMGLLKCALGNAHFLIYKAKHSWSTRVKPVDIMTYTANWKVSFYIRGHRLRRLENAEPHEYGQA